MFYRDKYVLIFVTTNFDFVIVTNGKTKKIESNIMHGGFLFLQQITCSIIDTFKFYIHFISHNIFKYCDTRAI